MKDNMRRSNTADARARARASTYSLLIRGCILVSGAYLSATERTHIITVLVFHALAGTER